MSVSTKQTKSAPTLKSIPTSIIGSRHHNMKEQEEIVKQLIDHPHFACYLSLDMNACVALSHFECAHSFVIEALKIRYNDSSRYIKIERCSYVSVKGATCTLNFKPKQFAVVDGQFLDMEKLQEFLKIRYNKPMVIMSYVFNSVFNVREYT